MEKNKPKFRLEDISKIPEDIKEMIKEIVAEISFNGKLQPALAGTGKLNYSCDPYCYCNTECRGHDECNYCRCVGDCRCDEHECTDCTCERTCSCVGEKCRNDDEPWVYIP